MQPKITGKGMHFRASWCLITLFMSYVRSVSVCLSRLRFVLGMLLLAVSHLASAHEEFNLMVFSKTAGFRHTSITNGIQMIQALGASNHFAVTATEDATAFTDANLALYSAVVFLSTTGDVLDTNQQASFERYIQAGGGYVGIHSASDTEYSWPWYGQLVGAYFQDHPAQQTATTLVADRVHPSTIGLPERWERFDEWYNFQSNPRGSVHVLATLDESTYSPGGGAMGYDHPIAWCHQFDGGRAWYTGAGHTESSYAEPLFQQHVLGGILWAAGAEEGDAGATIDSNYQKVVLDANPQNPMELSVAPDGRVIYVERGGRVMVWKPDTATTVQAGQIPVFSQLEDGLLGVALDPGFATNNWLYLYYAPTGVTPVQHLSRFTMSGDTLLTNSEIVMLTVPTQREVCCHSGGSLTFGSDGYLYVSLGDNTSPFESDNYTPIDERAGRSAYDAQKSSSNANDLRGKILRIKPQPDGSYTIPAGNLFPPGTTNTRPEIYVMGCRNPFRISVDAATGWLYWGEVGPDANSDNSNRGPRGYDEWNQARTAGNYGWPYFAANNQAYREYDFATTISGPYFDAASPTNNSPNNTGPLVLPPAQPAWIWYPYTASTVFPQLGSGSRTAMAGPVYQFDTNAVPARQLPAYFDQTLFIYEWSRNWIKEVKLDQNGDILAINPFLPTFNFSRPMDMDVGPDGALYLIEWGTGFSGNNADAKIVRIEYVGGNRAPVVVASASPDSGNAPLLVQFSSSGTYDPEPGDTLSYVWSYFGNGVTNSTDPNPSFSYATNGVYSPQLKVFDSAGNVTIANLSVTVGNNRPQPQVLYPPDGSVFDWGNELNFSAAVFDVEDGATTNGSISCSAVEVELSLGHNDHAHGLSQQNDCSGTFLTPPGHGGDGDNILLVLNARYTDSGAVGVPALTGSATALVQPRRKQAEHYSAASGVTTYLTADNNGVSEVRNIEPGDWLSFHPYHLTNLDGIVYRVAGGVGGQIELRTGATNGALLATANIPPTGGAYTNISVAFTNPGGTHELFFIFTGTPGTSNLFQFNWFEFIGAGVGIPTAPDTNPPVVLSARPGNGSSFLQGQTIPFAAEVTDDLLLSQVEFWVDGGLRQTFTSEPFKTLIAGLGNGGHTFEVRAVDFAGNWTTNTANLTVTTGSLPKGPYGGVPHAIPGRIETEDYDQGGAGLAYFEADSNGNEGGAYRTSEQVDIQSTGDSAGGAYNVGWIRSTEWLEYTVNSIGGPYDVTLRAASPAGSPGTVGVTLNGLSLGTFNIPSTGDWQVYASVTRTNVSVPAVTNGLLRLTITGGSGFLHNLNWIEFVALSVPPVLEWTSALDIPFVTAPAFSINTTNQSVTVPMQGTRGFYRLRANAPTSLNQVNVMGTNLVITYE